MSRAQWGIIATVVVTLAITLIAAVGTRPVIRPAKVEQELPPEPKPITWASAQTTERRDPCGSINRHYIDALQLVGEVRAKQGFDVDTCAIAMPCGMICERFPEPPDQDCIDRCRECAADICEEEYAEHTG